jgi:hypothetical protein
MLKTCTDRSRLQSLMQFIDRIASVPTLLVLMLLSVLFPVMVFPAHGIGAVRPPDLYFFYSPDQVHDYLAVLGAEGRRAYTRMALTSDLAFPVIYSAALSMALVLFLRKWLPSARRYLSLFPLLIVIADWGENLALVMVTRAFPARADAVAGLAATFTALKWVLIVLTMLMLLAVVAFGVARVMRAR